MILATAYQKSRYKLQHYILGPGDGLQVELVGIPEFSRVFTVGPDETIYLPRLRALYVEGLTAEEM